MIAPRRYLVVMMATAACCAAGDGGRSSPGAPPAAGPGSPLAGLEPPLLLYAKRCEGWPQGRRLEVSGNRFTWVDEAGEARRGDLSPQDLGALQQALRRASLATIATRARTGERIPCTTTVAATIDGVRQSVTESPDQEIAPDAVARWRELLAQIEELAASRI